MSHLQTFLQVYKYLNVMVIGSIKNLNIGSYFCTFFGEFSSNKVDKVCLFLEDSCKNLVSFKIVVFFVLICIESTTILKETRFAQLAS